MRVDNQTRVINEKLNCIALAKKNIDEAQKNKKAIDDNYNALEKSLLEKQLEYQQIELSLNTIKTIVQEQKSKLQDNEVRVNEFIKLENWKESFLNSPTDFVNFIKNVDLEWKSKNELLKNTENQIVALSEIIGKCEKYVLEIQPLISDAELDFTKHIIETQNLIPSFSVVYERIKERLKEKAYMEENINSIKLMIDDFINNSADITLERLSDISKIDDIQCFVQKNKFLDDELIKSKNTLSIKTEELKLHQDSEFKPQGDVVLDELELSWNSLINEKKSNEELLSDVRMKLALNEQNFSNTADYHKDLEDKDRVYHLWEQLAKAIGTTDNDNFRDVAQAYTMGILLDRANYYLKQLSSRYLLSCYPDSLAIMVQDMEMGAEMRAASSLSGGETFLVSLALALGLTSLNDEHFNMDMLFIDEGFGTLDNESLDMVMNTLESLHSLGRKVGIISHVDTLKERIPAKIQLVRNGKSASRVEIVRN